MENTLITTIAAVLGVLIVIAGAIGAWAALRVGRNTQTIDSYREAAQSYETLANAQKVEIAALREESDRDKTQIAKLQAQLQALQDIVTGKTALESLAVQVTADFTELRRLKLEEKDYIERAHRELVDGQRDLGHKIDTLIRSQQGGA